jgi:hypothetical protein
MQVRYSVARFLISAWIVTVVARADNLAINEEPENASSAKPLDRSCFVREEDGAVRYYLDGPLRDGELPYLQGRPIPGADGKLAVREEVPQSAIPPRILRAPPCPPGKHHLS